MARRSTEMVHLRLPEDLTNQLKVVAAKQGKPIVEIIRRAVETYLSGQSAVDGQAAVETMLRRAIRSELRASRELTAKAAFWSGTSMRLNYLAIKLAAKEHTAEEIDQAYLTAKARAAASMREPLEDLEALARQSDR